MQLPNAQQSVRSEINVTPLVDVCLVLLIIFMLITPALVREIPVDLPVTGKGKAPTAEGPLLVAMKEDQTILVDKAPVPLEALPGLLRQLKEANPDRAVMVQGDRHLAYENLSKVLESVDSAGFNRVGLITLHAAANGG